jgi:hypothetical protein
MLSAIAALLLTSAAETAAPCSAPEHRALDFWVGDWKLAFDGETGPDTARNRIRRDELGACAITEHFLQPSNGYAGFSISMYDPKTRQWRQTWGDNAGDYITLVGGPVSGAGHVFELRTVEPRGPERRHFRMIWQDVAADRLVWRWQRQEPEGGWSDQWTIAYRRDSAR